MTYSITDLEASQTASSQGIDNTATDAAIIANLQTTAALADELTNQIGPFTIESGYRSPALNAAVGGASESAHSEGKAIDFYPTTMSLLAYFQALTNRPDLAALMGEIYIKPSQGTMHVTTPLPELEKVGYYGILDPSTKVYRKLTSDELASFQAGVMPDFGGQAFAAATTPSDDSESDLSDSTSGISTTAMVAIAAAALIFFTLMVMKSRKVA